MMLPLGVSFIQETTVFREYGPLSGSTMRLSYEGAPKIGNSLSRQTFDGDARYYMRIGANGVFALRAYGFKSWGDAPGYTFFGGNSEMRGYEYREFLGHKGFYANAELRFPLIHAMATPIGILGGIRGVFFANVGGAGLEGHPSRSGTTTLSITAPLRDPNGVIIGRPSASRASGSPTRAHPTASASRRSRSASRALRLVVPHAVQQGVGELPLRQQRRFSASRGSPSWIGYDF